MWEGTNLQNKKYINIKLKPYIENLSLFNDQITQIDFVNLII